MTDSCPSTLLDTLSKRIRVLEHVRRGVDDRREIEEALGVSRQTVTRALQELEDVNAVRDTYTDGFEVTLYGELAYQRYDDLRSTYGWLVEAEELLKSVPSNVPVEARILEGAEVVIPDEHAPHQPLQFIDGLVESGDQLQSVVPVVLLKYVDLLHDLVAKQDIETDLLIADDLTSPLFATYRDQFRTWVSVDNCTVWRTTEPLPFGLAVTGSGSMWIGFHSDGGGVRGALVNDAEPAVDWARETFERYRESADEVLHGDDTDGCRQEPRQI
jgi:predicted transcriptional regulator